MSYYVLNEKLDGIEIYFDDVPSVHIRDYLKKYGFKWNNKKKCWYAKNCDAALEIAKAVVDEEHTFINTCYEIEDGKEDGNYKEAYYNAKIQEINDNISKAEKLLLPYERPNNTKQRNTISRGSSKASEVDKARIEYESKENLITINKSKSVSLQLNKLKLKDGKEVLDISEWKGNIIKDGVSLTEDELGEILYSYNRLREPCRKDTGAFHKNEIIFNGDYFKILYLGIREEEYSYTFDFEIQNTSDFWIRVDIEKLFICDCEFDSFSRIADTLQPKKKCVGDVSISKKKLNKQWIKKIWEYSLIEVEFHFSFAESKSELLSWDIDEYRIKNLKIAPDFILRDI